MIESPGGCGCRQCGGPQLARDWRDGRRVLRWAEFIRSQRPNAASRVCPPEDGWRVALVLDSTGPFASDESDLVYACSNCLCEESVEMTHEDDFGHEQSITVCAECGYDG